MRDELNITSGELITEPEQGAVLNEIVEETAGINAEENISAEIQNTTETEEIPQSTEAVIEDVDKITAETNVNEAEAVLNEIKAEEQQEASYLFALPVISEDAAEAESTESEEMLLPQEQYEPNGIVSDSAVSTEGESSANKEMDAVSEASAINKEEEVKATEKETNIAVGKRVRDMFVLIGMALIFAVCSTVLLASGGKNIDKVTASKNFAADVANSIISLKSDSLGAVFDLPKVYILPINEEPAPVANPAGYSSEILEDGTEVLTYNDETISVRYWCERIYDSNCHFADITVAHPTQLRTAFAGGKYSTTVRRIPQEIAQQVNAVIAMNADYCGYRKSGVLIRQDVVYRTNPLGWDVLLIDSEGDFHIMNDYKVEFSGIFDEYKIVNTLQFGPSLIVDGEINIINPDSGCGEYWNNDHVSPRTGIGQIGRLHYLFCCVEGRTDFSQGIYTPQLAEIMLDKGCVQAYNLDGGMSTTMIFNGEAMNYPMWGGQRVVTDIVYCATAIPNEE